MNRLKIFGYCLKRMLFTKMFAGFLLIIAVYSYMTFASSIVIGARGTAPYSEWSFIGFLNAISFPLNALLLYLVSTLFSKRERGTRNVLVSTPLHDWKYDLTRALSPVCACVIAALAAIMVCFWFYAALFGFGDFGGLLLCAVLILLPQMLFLTGLGLSICRFRSEAAYAVIGLLLISNFIGLAPPVYLDVTGATLRRSIENAIPVNAVIPFAIPLDFYVSRAVFSLAGISLGVLGRLMESRKTG